MKSVMLLLISSALLGCSVSEKNDSPLRSETAVTNARTARLDTVNVSQVQFAASLEVEMLLGLWVHLDKQCDEFEGRLGAANDQERVILTRFIQVLKAERQKTWEELFKE